MALEVATQFHPLRAKCQSPRLLFADDQEMVRDGLRAILQEQGFEVVGDTSDGLEALRLCQELRPEIALLDINLPSLNGIDCAREIRKTCPRTKIILLTMQADGDLVLASLRAGVVGYVLKRKPASTLIQAILAVCDGEVYLSPGVSRVVVDAYLAKDDTPPDPLSVREHEVLQLLAEGKNVKEIGSILEISTKTAESHRTNIMRKLNIHEIAGLVRYAIRKRLVGM